VAQGGYLGTKVAGRLTLCCIHHMNRVLSQFLDHDDRLCPGCYYYYYYYYYYLEYYVNVGNAMLCGMLLSGVPDYCGGATSVKYELLMTYPDTDSTDVVYHGKDTSCRVHGLQPGRAYCFQVRALNDAGVSVLRYYVIFTYKSASNCLKKIMTNSYLTSMIFRNCVCELIIKLSNYGLTKLDK